MSALWRQKKSCIENDDTHTTPLLFEALLSYHSNLFTCQWKHLRAFVKNLWICFFSLGQKIFLSTPRWLPAHILSAETRGGGCPTYTLKGSLSFTSFCGFQGRNEGELLLTRTSHFFRYFMSMLFFQSESFTATDISSHTSFTPIKGRVGRCQDPTQVGTPHHHSYCCALQV